MIEILSPAIFTSVQDGGRYGWQRFGMPVSGAMDWFALQAANRLAGNPPDAACLEVGISSAAIISHTDTLIAVCGAGYQLFINTQPFPLWQAIRIRRGDQITLEKTSGGVWACLAVSGGIQTTPFLASRSACPRAGIGSNPLPPGSLLPVAEAGTNTLLDAGCSLPAQHRPSYTPNPVIGIIPACHQSRFTASAQQTFLQTNWQIGINSDRMGFRLEGATIEHEQGADVLSLGMMMGTIQVPADGCPIIMMADHPTTGGYTQIATVISAHLPLLAQSEAGIARLRFAWVDADAARASLLQMHSALDAISSHTDEDWMLL